MKTIHNTSKKLNGFLLLLTTSLILFAGCEKSEMLQTSKEAQSINELRNMPSPPPPFIMLVIEHNSMNASLPDYDVYLRSDGHVTYKGWSNVATRDVVEFNTDAETVSYIKNLFESTHFFNITPIPFQHDDPFVATTYSNRHATKTLVDYDQGMPQLLIQSRKKAEEKLNISKYIYSKFAVAPSL